MSKLRPRLVNILRLLCLAWDIAPTNWPSHRTLRKTAAHAVREPAIRFLTRLAGRDGRLAAPAGRLSVLADLSEDESELVLRYRALDMRSKVRMLDMVERLHHPPTVRPVIHVNVAGDIAQQINGDVYGDITAPCYHALARKKK